MIGLNEAYANPSPDSPAPPPLDQTSLLKAVFRHEGLLQSALNLAHRPQQEQMALRTLEAWQADEALFFEAGTGVGKSLAYLIPGILRAMAASRQLVVSTHTIALQEQIESKDLQLCRALFQRESTLKPYAEFKHAVMLGRGNYLCGARLKQALLTKTELFPNAGQLELQRIAEWASSTTSGLKQDLHPSPLPEVWEWVQADGHACNPRNCNPQTCFYRRAREALRSANVIIVNHSLLFSLLSAGLFPRGDTPGILFPHDFMVIDEAHTLPHIATEYFGLHLTEIGLRRQLQKLYTIQKGKARGLISRIGHPELRGQVSQLGVLANDFFGGIHEAHLSQNRPFRLREAEWTDNPLDGPLRSLLHGLEKCESRMEEGSARDELTGARRVLQAYRDALEEIITLSDPQSVYWLEPGPRQSVHLRSAPLEVAGPLRERLFSRQTGLLLTSATLAEGPRMDSFQQKVGAEGTAAVQVTSPFDYPLQMEILIHPHAPAPTSENGRLDIRFLASEILRLSLEIPGGTLALFTSYRDLQAVALELTEPLRAQNRPLLCQGTSTSRSALVEQMKQAGNAVLLGTDSFWTGVDIPGSPLSQVIITRLPFENPSHPVAEARSDLCRARGASPFNELVLPAALIKFRQGIGRLIRNHTDEGRLVILDSRILQKSYGTLFLDVLPHDQYRKISS